jgi:hypothetical protein
MAAARDDSGLVGGDGSGTEFFSAMGGEMMLEPTPMPQIELVEPEARNDEEVLVHEWRIEQLRSLGLTAALAETFAGVIDWHDRRASRPGLPAGAGTRYRPLN